MEAFLQEEIDAPMAALGFPQDPQSLSRERELMVKRAEDSAWTNTVAGGPASLMDTYAEAAQKIMPPVRALYLVRIAEIALGRSPPNRASDGIGLVPLGRKPSKRRRQRANTDDIVSAQMRGTSFVAWCYDALGLIATSISPFDPIDGLVYARAKAVQRYLPVGAPRGGGGSDGSDGSDEGCGGGSGHGDSGDSWPSLAKIDVQVKGPQAAAPKGEAWVCLGPPLRVLTAAGGWAKIEALLALTAATKSEAIRDASIDRVWDCARTRDVRAA